LAADWAKGHKRSVCLVLTNTIIPKPKPEGLGYGNLNILNPNLKDWAKDIEIF